MVDLTVFCQKKFGFNISEIGSFTVLNVISMGISSYISGYLGDKHGHKISMLIAYSFHLIAVILALLSKNMFWVYCIFISIGAGQGAFMPSAMNLIYDFANLEDKKTVILPRKAVLELTKLLNKSTQDMAEIHLSDNYFSLVDTNTKIPTSTNPAYSQLNEKQGDGTVRNLKGSSANDTTIDENGSISISDHSPTSIDETMNNNNNNNIKNSKKSQFVAIEQVEVIPEREDKSKDSSDPSVPDSPLEGRTGLEYSYNDIQSIGNGVADHTEAKEYEKEKYRSNDVWVFKLLQYKSLDGSSIHYTFAPISNRITLLKRNAVKSRKKAYFS